jgi:aspartokinase/homoserine dehydrogenase 1
VFLTGEFTDRTKDLVMSFGERLSCALVDAYFQQRKLKSSICDARTVVKTNSEFGYAKVDFNATNKQLKTCISDKKDISCS